MISGKYTALSGALVREQAMENISNNLANINTPGFKRDGMRFDKILQEAQNEKDVEAFQNEPGATATDYSEGPFRVTDNRFDLAIQGDGFFKVRNGADTFYTRNGSFTVDQDGILKTDTGYVVEGEGGPIQLNLLAGSDVAIDEAGGIYVDGAQEGRLQIFAVDDKLQLEKRADQLFQLKEGGTERVTDQARVVQGSLELSNVNIMAELTRMIDTNRKYEVLTKVIRSYSTLGDRLTELGTLG